VAHMIAWEWHLYWRHF